MKTKNSLILLATLATLIFFENCGERERFPEMVDMIFVIPLTVSPVKEKFIANDTITLTAAFPDTVKEFFSGKYFKLKDFDFYTRIIMTHLVSPDLYLSQQPGNAFHYDIFSLTGSVVIAGSLGGFVNFKYFEETYWLRVKLVPKKSGLYNFVFISGYVSNSTYLDHIINLGFTPDGRKKIPVLRNIYFVVNEGNNNFNLLSRNSRLALNNVALPDNLYGERYGTFTFRVVN
jgi:hypothetical protein